MDPKRLFRKAALEKLSSPERLDVMMQVTAPAAWLALAALGAVLLIVLVWGIFGSISIKVRGKGMLMAEQGLQKVTSAGSGQIEEVLVRERQQIRAGQAVARIDTSQLEKEALAQEETLEDALRAQEVHDQGDSLRLRDLNSKLADDTRRLSDLERMFREGDVSRNEVNQVRTSVIETRQAIRDVQESILDRQNRTDDARRKLEVLKSQLAAQGRVISPFDGYVIAVSAKRGAMLSPGEEIVSVEPEGDVEAVIYVPAGEGNKVHENFTAQISPGGVRVEEWGFLKGEVVWVSDYPVSRQEAVSDLVDEQLAADFLGKSPKVEVRIRLIPDSTTASGYTWTSSKGPNVQIRAGTVCSGNVTVEKKKPISYVIPIIKKSLGI
jgi:HlyD family secretion protein